MMTPVEMLAVWASAIFSLAILSFLWKENPIYSIAERIAVGGGAAHGVLFSVAAIRSSGVEPLMKGQVLMIIPLLLGLLMFTRLTKWAWVSRYPTMVMIGVGIGVMLGAIVEGQIIGQIRMSITGLYAGGLCPICLFSGLVVLIGMLTTMSYFIFTKPHTGGLGISARIGKVFMMISFGCNWAGELLWYLTQMVARLLFLINVWIKQVILGIIV